MLSLRHSHEQSTWWITQEWPIVNVMGQIIRMLSSYYLSHVKVLSANVTTKCRKIKEQEAYYLGLVTPLRLLNIWDLSKQDCQHNIVEKIAQSADGIFPSFCPFPTLIIRIYQTFIHDCIKRELGCSTHQNSGKVASYTENSPSALPCLWVIHLLLVKSAEITVENSLACMV